MALFNASLSAGGSSVEIDGVEVDGDLKLKSSIRTLSLGTLPYGIYYGSAVVLNNEIHILGCSSSTYSKYHYKWNGSSWTSVSTLPFKFNSGSAVVLNNEIHILGAKDYNLHYKWDGSTWISVSTPPELTPNYQAVVLNEDIYIPFGGNNKIFKYSGSTNTWTTISSTFPYQNSQGSTIVYNNQIHILGGNTGSGNYYHYKWNGSTWTSVSTLPYSFYDGSVVKLNGVIHILGGNSTATKHYKWNGSSWVSVSTLPFDFYAGSAVVLYKAIHILGGIAEPNSAYGLNVTIYNKVE